MLTGVVKLPYTASLDLRRLNKGTYGQQNVDWFVAIQFYQVLLVVMSHVILWTDDTTTSPPPPQL